MVAQGKGGGEGIADGTRKKGRVQARNATPSLVVQPMTNCLLQRTSSGYAIQT